MNSFHMWVGKLSYPHVRPWRWRESLDPLVRVPLPLVSRDSIFHLDSPCFISVVLVIPQTVDKKVHYRLHSPDLTTCIRCSKQVPAWCYSPSLPRLFQEPQLHNQQVSYCIRSPGSRSPPPGPLLSHIPLVLHSILLFNLLKFSVLFKQ